MAAKIEERRLGTMLAALRFYQSALGEIDIPVMILQIANDGGAYEPLDAAEIDELCEELNV